MMASALAEGGGNVEVGDKQRRRPLAYACKLKEGSRATIPQLYLDWNKTAVSQKSASRRA